MMTNLQSRLAKAQDNLRRKAIDNSVRLISNPIDCIHLSVEKNFRGDATYITPTSLSLVQVSFPPLKDIPYRRIKRDDGSSYNLMCPVAVAEDGQEDKFTVEVPYSNDLYIDDLLIRVFLDDDYSCPTIMPMKVTDLLGDVGGMKMVHRKVVCAMYTDNLPDDIINAILKLSERRVQVGY